MVIYAKVIIRNSHDYDHEQVNFTVDGEMRRSGGYRGKEEGSKICFVRCPVCERENYGPNVSSGTCAFCGYDANNGKTKVLEIKES